MEEFKIGDSIKYIDFKCKYHPDHRNHAKLSGSIVTIVFCCDEAKWEWLSLNDSSDELLEE